MALRTKAGRLGVAARRRMAPSEPGRVALLDSHARKRKWGDGHRTVKDSIHADFAVGSELVFDIDCRKLLEHVSLALADHYERSLFDGQTADGRDRLPELSETTLAVDPGRVQKTFGVRSGWMALHWWLGKITGGMFSARRLIKPNGSDGRDVQINRWLAPKGGAPVVDLQSVEGAAAAVIENALQTYAAGCYGETVATPAKANLSAGVLPDLRR